MRGGRGVLDMYIVFSSIDTVRLSVYLILEQSHTVFPVRFSNSLIAELHKVRIIYMLG